MTTPDPPETPGPPGSDKPHSQDAEQLRRQYMQALTQDARVLKFARMLPAMDGPLTDDNRQQVRLAYAAYTDRMGISNAAAAKQIGVSASVLSQWVSNTYKGDNDKVTRAVNGWIERDARARDARIELPYVPTRIAEDMRLVAQLAHEHQCMAAIVCPAGTGKTKVIKVLAEEWSGWYVYADEDMSPKSFLEAVAEAVGVTDQPKTIPALKQAIVRKIAGTGRPLFLDEVHRLRPHVFSRIRSLHDRSECPVIMTGTDEILVRIDDRSSGRGQLHSRCVTYNAMDQAANVEGPDGGKQGRPLYSRKEIEALFAHMPVRLTEGGMDMIWALACLPGYGCLRTVKRALELAYRKWADQEIGRDELLTVLKLFSGARGQMMADLAQQHIKVHRKAG